MKSVLKVLTRFAKIWLILSIVCAIFTFVVLSVAQNSYKSNFVMYEVSSVDVENNTCTVTDGSTNITVYLLGIKLKDSVASYTVTRRYLGAKVYLINDPNLPVATKDGVRQAYIMLDRNDEILQLHMMLDGFADFDCPRAADRYHAYRECSILKKYPC